MRTIQKKSLVVKEVEGRLGQPIEEVLRVLYVDHNMSLDEIASSIGLSYVTVYRLLMKANIVHRKIEFGEGGEGHD